MLDSIAVRNDRIERKQAEQDEYLRKMRAEMLTELERGGMSAKLATGWQPPEVFVAKGRDGVTDIWGIICRPRVFDPAKKYAVIEEINKHAKGEAIIRPRRTGTSQSKRFLFCSSSRPIGSGRADAGHHCPWLVRGACLRRDLPNLDRCSTVWRGRDSMLLVLPSLKLYSYCFNSIVTLLMLPVNL